MRRGRFPDSRFRIQCSTFAVLFLAAAPLFAQAPEKAGLGVVDFDVKGGLAEKDAGAIVAEIFIGRIDVKKYRLYERTQLNRLLKERALQATGLVADPEKAIQFGKAARIRYLLIGTVSRLGGNIILGARTIDCESGEIGERATLSGVFAHRQAGMAGIKACRLCRPMRKNTPDSEQAHFQLGYALGEKGEVDAAISEYNDLLRRAPGHGFAHFNLGSLFRRKDDMDGAVREYSEAVRLLPDNAAAQYNLALACARKRDARRAVDALRRAIELDPKYRTGLETNKAFEAIHGDKEFKRLIGK